MKHINLKSIFATFLLLVGVCQVSWGADFTRNSTIYLNTGNINWVSTNEQIVAIFYYSDNTYWCYETNSAYSPKSELSKGTATTKIENNIYSVKVPDATVKMMYFIRKNGNTVLNYSAKMSADDMNNNNCVKLNDWDNSSVWSTYTPVGGGDDTKLSIDGVTQTEEKSIYAIHLWKEGTDGIDYTFCKTNKDNYYMVTGSWDMSSLTGFGLKKNNVWKGGGGETAKIGEWVKGVYASSDGSLPTTGTVTAIYFYYDGSNSALYLATSGSTNTYTVTISAGTGGSVTPNGNLTIGGNPVPITAIPASGYAFENWPVTGGASVANANVASTTVTATADGTVTATFKDNGGTSDTYTYYYYNKYGWDNVQAHIWNGTTDLTGGWGSGKMTQINSTRWYFITFHSAIQPKSAIFHNGDKKDVDANVDIDSDPTKVYYRSDINADQKWWNGFVQKITITAGEGGKVSPTGEQVLTNGSSITATANDGYAFAGWTCSNGVGVADDKNAQTTLNATADGTLTASFAKIHQIVLYGTMQTDGSVGTFREVGPLVASEDNTTASLSLELQANETYAFKLTKDGSWLGSKSTMERGNSTDWDLNEDNNAGLKTDIAGTYTFTWTYATSLLTVTYPGYSVEIKSANTEQGTVSPAGIQGIDNNGNLTVTVAPKFGYKFDSWECTDGINATTPDANNRATITATKDGKATAKFVTNPDIVNNPRIKLDGNFNGWNNKELMPLTSDGKQATYTLHFDERGPQEFGIREVKSETDWAQAAWWWCASGTTIRRNNCTGIKFKKQGEYAGKNPILVVDAIGDYVFTYTYADSTLTVTYPEKVVTPQKYKLYGDFYDTGRKEYEGSWSTDLKTGTWTLEGIPEGAHMFMLKAADGNLYFNASADAATIQRENPSVYVDNEYSSDNRENITLNADEAGTYTFQLDFDNRLITVTYPGNIKIKYRLVYAEQKPDGKYEKYHPSTPYINAVAEDATDERRDTVSLHVRCSIPVYHRNSLNQIDKINNYDPNPNNIYVYLQKWDGTKWETKDTVVLQEGNEARVKRESGVYNFVVVQDPEATDKKVYIDPNIEPYKGNYYIRTNVAPGRWNNYKQIGNQITYSDYAAQHKHFEYYWCKWVDMAKTEENRIRDNMANLKFTIANDYSNCVSDTCLDELDNCKFTVNGRLGHNANVRWMWHSKTNDIDRAYVAGKNANLFLVNKGGTINDKTEGTFNFEDRQNWTYKIELTATPKAKFAITKKPHDGAGDQRYWVVGNETEGVTLIEGEGRNTYRMRIVYDFKSDHLIYAWVPDDTTDISKSIDLGATVVCMRKDNHNATQVRITPAETTLSNVHEALGVLSLSKKEFFDKPEGWNTWEREYYWISFPFDVNVSDIFSTFVWDRDYIIQEYDGQSRADNGCWADSPTYWRSLSKTDKMEAGKGYVLYISHEAVSKNNVYGHEPTELNIYFPSTGVTEITGAIKSVEVPQHTCTITRNNRDIYDSNWNLIGVPTWVNIEGMKDGPDPDEQPENKNVSNIIINGDTTVGFYYHFNTGTEDGKPGNTWTPRNVKEGEEQLVFKNMRSYLIQWAGTINWSNKSWEETPSTQGLQARRAAEAKSEEYTLRLELSRGETALDQTFVRLQEDGDVTADYDMNYDMTKIINPGANLYSLIGEKRIQAGANVLPLPAENTTVYVPMGVVADKDGMYRFSMPDGTEGMLVSLADHETGMTYNLTTGYCDVPLTKGTYEQRFVLEIQPKKGVTTGCNESTTDDGTLRKVLIDGNLYIQRGDALYDAAGRAL